MLTRTSLVLSMMLSASTALAQSGVSDDRVSLPDGPGSIGGVGENVSVVGNMGAMALNQRFRVPRGFEDVTPDLGLRYSSSEGSGVVGIGWSMDLPYVERMTARGLPSYVADDMFASNGSEQLVRVSQSMTDAVYRARYERAFVRYTWKNVGDGKAGYFTAEYPDGTVGYFGADRDGNLVPEARVSKPDASGTFRYQMVDLVDPFGHRVHYGYVLSGAYPLLDSVEWVHDAQGKARFSMRFVYEARPDTLSDGKPGFDLQLTQRLSSVRIFSGSELIRQYDLSYESETVAGGMSRLASVSEKGRGGAVYPIKPTFSYSQALGGACAAGCGKPFVVNMGTLTGGVDLRTGNATLLDINGDSLPDVLDTTGGVHRFFVAKPSTDGKPTFANPVLTSQANTAQFQLSNPSVQVLDVNGDGFSDMIAARTGDVLCNNGSGDWSGSACLANGSLDVELADDPSDTGVQDPLHVRFFDYDNDKRIDMLRTTSADATDVRRDTGMGFAPVTVDPIGEVFDESPLQLAELNGDGLLDPVTLSDAGTLRYRLNFGFGKWSDWRTIQIVGLTQSDLQRASMQDLNGDGLDDIVVTTPGSIKILLNRNGGRFADVLALDASAVDGGLPEQADTTSVLFADMNGNGSDDVVYVSSSGQVQFVDAFPVKPNLLARIENGIGMVQAVSYGTSLAELARDGGWAYKLNYAVNLVKRVDQWVTLTGSDSGGLHELIDYAYHDGFYDGVEKQFRGFSTVDTNLQGDALDSQQPGLRISSYDVGAKDAYYNGLLLQDDSYSVADGRRVPLKSVRSTYGDCPVGGVPASGLSFVVRHVCEQKHEEVIQEGAAADEWASTRTLLEYDPWGNVGRSQALGVVGMGEPEALTGCRACLDADDVACGPMCAGDETFTETTYVDPEQAGKWFLRKPAHLKVYGVEGGPLRDVTYYYDGDAFVGLAEGQLTQGKLTRETRKVDAMSSVDVRRAQFDAHGNEIAVLDPLGSPMDMTGHRARFEYDPTGLNQTATENLLSDAQGPYSLRREYGYESVFNEISEATAWILMRGGAAASSRDSNRYRYDDFGRIARAYRPGDGDETPTTEYSYELANPVSRVTVAERTQPNGALDSNVYVCMDGRARTVQVINSVSEGRFLADGFRALNSRGLPVRAYQPYELSAPSCATAAPEGVAFTAYRYDSSFRELGTTLPDAALYEGKASETRVVYGVLSTTSYDEEDSASGGKYSDTPTTRRFDGEGRLLSIERSLGQSSALTRMRYDSLDNLRGYIDAAGNLRTQEFDLLGRVTSVSDPNSGLTQFQYDAASNLVRRQTAGGDVVRHAYDGMNRRTQTWNDADRDGSLITETYDTLPDCKLCSGAAGALVEARYPIRIGSQPGQGFDRFGFDARRRPIYEARSLEGKLFETSHVFDQLDRRVSTTYPDGQVLTRSYDGAGRLTAIAGLLNEQRYDVRGQTSAELLANGAQATFGYDDRLRLSRHAVGLGQDMLFDLAYERDRVGNYDSAVDSGAHLKRGFSNAYDAWYRPLASMLVEGTPEAETITLGYDAIDNVTTRTSSRAAASTAQAGAFAYDKAHPNATTSFAGVTFGYSADGDLERRGALELAWDYQGRLVSAASGGQLSAQFGYGAAQQRVIKDEAGHTTYYVSSEFEVRDGVGVTYVRDLDRRYARIENAGYALRVLADANADGTISVADAWLDQKNAQAGVERTLAASAKRLLLDAGVVTTYLHQDALGNVVAASDAMGKLVAERAFYDWGDERASSGFVDEHGFSGQERDQSTGLVHYLYRNLDPQAGRWVSSDPAFEVVDAENVTELGESTTAYAFVANRFGNAVDPLGLKLPKSKTKGKAKGQSSKKGSRKEAKPGSAAKEQRTKERVVPASQTHYEYEAGDTSEAANRSRREGEERARQEQAQQERNDAIQAKHAARSDLLSKIGRTVHPFATRQHENGTPGTDPRKLGARVVAAVTAVSLAVAGGIAGYVLNPSAAADSPDSASATPGAAP